MRRIVYISFLLLIFTSCNYHAKNKPGLNEEASVRNLENLPENPLLLNAITVSIQPWDSTMAILYGNDLAYSYASANGDGNYPASAILYEVTWQLQADDQWFGANIPRVIKTIERIRFSSDNKHQYTLFKGDTFQKSTPFDEAERVSYITGQIMAVSP